MSNINDLNQKFGIENELDFECKQGDLEFVTITNRYAKAELCLYGGHVTRYIPKDHHDLLWMSPISHYEIGKPIRGGIPVCFPWFGPHESDETLPMHGFARLIVWDVLKTFSTSEGETCIVLGLSSSEDTKNDWPFDFVAELKIQVGKKLNVELQVQNIGNEKMRYSCALHSYYNISDISNIKIEGLKNAKYYWGFSQELLQQTEQQLEIVQEENRRYIHTCSDCMIHDSGYNRCIKASKEGSNVTVVWNPWTETIQKMDDLPNDAYKSYVCIEATNAYDDIVELDPKEMHCTKAILSLENECE